MMSSPKKHTATGVMVIKNDRGLHTRPATELVKIAVSYKSDITLKYRDVTANCKSLLGILMLAAAKGAKVTVEATGEDATEALEAILHLARQNFNISY